MSWIILVESDISKHFAMQTHVLEFCRCLAQLTPLNLLTQTPAARLTDEFAHRTLPVKDFRPHTLAELANSRRAAANLRQLRKKEQLELLYVRATGIGVWPLWFARQAGIPSILEVNGAWSDEQRLERASLSPGKRAMVVPAHWLRSLSLDLACRLAGKIVAVTPDLRAYLHGRGNPLEKITVVANGVNPSLFSPKDQSQARGELGLEQGALWIGYIGSLAAWQGVDILIDAFRLLVEPPGTTCRLLIVGDGPQRTALEERSRDLIDLGKIHFSGAKPYEQIPRAIAACDCLVAPKRPLSSGYSALKVLEYMACARPLAASRLPGLEFVESAGAGLLCSPNDPQDLSRKLAILLKLTPAERQALGARGRAWVLENATWERAARQVFELAGE